jgi:hypothetical protein
VNDNAMDYMYKLLSPELLIPIVAILMPLAIVVIALAFARQSQERRHRTVVHLLEKGLPVPPELLRGSAPGHGSPLMRALTLVGLGVGLSAFLYLLLGNRSGVWAAGLIPLAIGVAQLIALKLEPPKADARMPHEPR